MNRPFGDKGVYNFTPHPVKVLDDGGNVIAEWESSGSLRIKYQYEAMGWSKVLREGFIDGIEATAPIPADADVLIVSRAMAMVMIELPSYVSVFYPDGEVRDPKDGRIVIGCRYLTRAPARGMGYVEPDTGHPVSVRS